MASADSDDDDHKSLKEEMLTCQLCFEVYKTPKLLSCQHSFCEHCLERWVQTNHGILVCPCCRQHVSLPVGRVKGLPTNRVISHFFDYIDRSKRKAAESQGVPCETCSSNNTADNRCIECFQYLCGRCSIVHGKVRKTRKHRLMPVGEFEKERLTNPTIEQPETYCEKHSDIAIDVFCKTCEICVCLKCALTEHPNPTHQYVSVDKAAIKAKGDFREFVQKLDQDRIRTADARNAVVHELLQLEENLKTGMEKIDNHADKIIQNVREMQKKTKATYKKAFDIKNEVLKSQIQNLERREKSLSNTREFAEMQINYASSAQFLLLKDEMKQQIQNVLSTKVNTDLEENSCLDFKVDASPAVDEFGQVQTSSVVGHMSELDGLFAENLTVGEEHTLNIRKKDSKGFDDAAGPYEEANAEDNVSGAVHSRVLQVENSTVNASLCDGTVEIPSEGNYQLKACGQQTSRTPKFMRLCAAGSSTVKLYRKVTGILNKLTPQKFQTLTQQVLDLPIDTEDRLKGVVDLVFEKAISEPQFSVVYANMCRCLMSMKVPRGDGNGNVNFRKLLLNKCQEEFEKDKDEDDEIEAKKKAMEEAETKEDKEKRKEEYDSYETKMMRRSLGNIRFIGELFKLKMLTEPIMHDCVVKLLTLHDHQSLECLSGLLLTIGKDLDHEKAKPIVDKVFVQMDRIVKSKKYSARVRFLLQDVIELRGSNWVPRRDENNPKTIEQIHKETKLTQQLLFLQQQCLPQSNKRVRGRGDRRQGQADDAWSMISSTRSRPSFDPNKYKVTKKTVYENIQLGPGGRPGGVFGGWGRSSSGGTGSKSQQKQQEAIHTPTNRFQALASEETQVYDISRRGSRELGRGRDNKGSRQLSGLRRSSSRESARDGRNREREEAIAIAKNLSSSQALAERGKDRARKLELWGTTHVPAEPKNVGNEMSEDAMEKKCKAILEEFMHLRDTREVQTCIAELRSPSMLYIFVRIAVEQSLKRNVSTRQACGTLMYDLIREGLMEKQQYIKGFAEILKFAEDIVMDIRNFWTYMGEFIAPLVLSGKIPMNILQDISRPLHGIGKAGLLTAEVLLVASKIIGEARIAELWHNSGLEWSSLLPAGGDVNEFLERKGLLFTAPNSSRTGSQTATEGMPISKIQGHLEHLLHRDRASNSEVFDWIDANVVKGRRKDSDFIRALMTAVCQSAVSGEGSSYRCEINEVKNRAAVLQKYFDNDDKLELQALYALQALNYKLDSPPSLLRIFFDKLYDEDVISEEAFYEWEKSDDPDEQLGKRVALKSVTAFFTWLREADDGTTFFAWLRKSDDSDQC